jgi:hypothetical protein
MNKVFPFTFEFQLLFFHAIFIQSFFRFVMQYRQTHDFFILCQFFIYVLIEADELLFRVIF